VDFMNGEGGGAAWEDGSDVSGNDGGGRVGPEGAKVGDNGKARSREGEWESGKGRCAVTGRRVLGGTEGLRRVLV
jgi:peroxin-12